eukprot:14748629-Alexandrium_andersonii.AAC.1
MCIRDRGESARTERLGAPLRGAPSCCVRGIFDQQCNARLGAAVRGAPMSPGGGARPCPWG